ncbi:MAG: hypothetical protein KC550_02985 [Nanoarchaeota archaeon]|nr:hypothetical protein [Nanoarchaeota archaeon]
MVFGIDNKTQFWKGFGLGIMISVITVILMIVFSEMISYMYEEIILIGLPIIAICLGIFLIYDNFQNENRNFAKGLIASIVIIPVLWGIFILIIIIYLMIFGFGF